MRALIITSVFLVIVILIYIISSRASSRRDEQRIIERREKFMSSNKLLALDDRPDHLLWFIQISDIHISIFKDPTRYKDFSIFVNETIDTIKPPIVLASGDLTDGRDKDALGSRQFEEEWKIYGSILRNASIEKRTVWMDIRGNHDNFNVPYGGMESFFGKFSIQGPQHKRSYMKTVTIPGGEKVSFIAVDTCLEPGPKRPFNFVGVLTQNHTDEINLLVEEAKRAGTNYTIWFGHYPTSCVATNNRENKNLRKIISEDETGLAYMCGHLHTLGDLVMHMYAMQEDAFIELELADWKKSRRFRVAAIDHGRLSFIDVKHRDWPIILITNPKHALFHIPHRMESKQQLESTHIRLLTFSPDPIEQCSVTIDGESLGECEQVSTNFFVKKWDPKKYSSNYHTIEVTVKDKAGRENKQSIPFKMNEVEWLSYGALAKFIIIGDITNIFKGFFYVALLICVAPLIILRIWHTLVVAGVLNRQAGNCRSSLSCIQRFWIFSSIDRLFWPLVGFCIYIAIGPWAYGELIEGQNGVIFIWGIYVNGQYFPGSLTYMYGFCQLVCCQLPLILIYSKFVETRYFEVIGMPAKKHRGWIVSPRKMSHGIFFIILSLEVVLTVFFGMAYGTIGILVGPLRTWSILMLIALWFMARKIPDKCFRSAIYVWNSHKRTSSQGEQGE